MAKDSFTKIFYVYLVLCVALLPLNAASLVTGLDDSFFQKAISLLFIFCLAYRKITRTKNLNFKFQNNDYLWIMTLFGLVAISFFVSFNNNYSFKDSFISAASIILGISILFLVKGEEIILDNFKVMLERWAIIYFYVFTIIFLALYLLLNFIGLDFNFTFGNNLTALALIILFAQRRFRLFFIFSIIIILSGKRNVYFLAFVPIILMMIFSKFWSLNFKIILKFIFWLTLAIVAYFVAKNNDVNLISENVLEKIIALNIFSTDVDYNRLGSNRIEEIEFASLEFAKIKMGWLFGAGAGFIYSANFVGGHEELRNLHFTPLSLFFKFGFIFSLLFYVMLLFYWVVGCFKYINSKIESELLVALLSYLAVYVMFYQFTNYGIVSDYSFWAIYGVIVNGYIYKIQRNNKILTGLRLY